MIRRIIYVLIAALLLSSCGAKKRRSTQRKGAPVVVNSERPTTRTTNDLETEEVRDLYPMPEDRGRFERFPISDTKDYIETFAEIAQYEMRAFGIPASITLAQGILESGSGKGELTLKTNNHFGIKCHTGWEGEFDFHDDDAKGECFRKYNHPMYSFRDHSIFLSTRSRYAFLFNYKRDDYKKWAHGLRQAGYATDRRYPQKLISIIENYNLYEYDEAVVENGLPTVREPRQYDVFTHKVEKGDTLYGISKRYDISVDELRRLNNLNDNIISVGQVLNIRVTQ
ncbi:mannosyl-glycoprotein endo-beta-N-acetylglucosamidase [Allomuricauda ruestringensis DSM 13258]|uniref:Peptidoglycan hydrolase n=1 Tax=Allomuricauda ruestringensis (strain DSM 13258 / CIP 107369 / LMG 19739 / B1) TaxID=886377 RepID=G2PK76_ALLRU|nr:glucosaminidase domain-containing protein [Allomuricauda ruestringensis]AEM69850.1 mannosyl-glycoprotein endo-beta-N-acetylglucosamidase [Allomuricauda ruestringensis DSM 13258]